LQIANKLEISLNWLLTGQEYSTSVEKVPGYHLELKPNRSVPIVGEVGAGFPFTYSKECLADCEYMQIPSHIHFNSKKAMLVRVGGASMEPHIYNDDYLLIEPLLQNYIEDGSDYVVIGDEGALVKKIIKQSRGFKLFSYNAEFPPMYQQGDFKAVFRIVSVLPREYRGGSYESR
jgi:SOS-response transcriptional repressor LexA